MSSVGAGRLLDDLREVLAEPVVGHAARDLDARLRHVGELDRVVRVGPDRLGEVLADLALDDVEGGDELDVADVVAAEVDVHQAGDEVVFGRRSCSTRRPAANELAQLPTPMIATRTLPFAERVSMKPLLSSLEQLRANEERSQDDCVPSQCRQYPIAQGRTPQGASTRPAVITTTRVARSPERPRRRAVRASRRVHACS